MNFVVAADFSRRNTCIRVRSGFDAHAGDFGSGSSWDEIWQNEG